MADTYSSNLRIVQQVNGENAGVWGDRVDAAFEMLEDAISDVVPITLTTTSKTLSIANNAADEARGAVLVFSGSPGGTCTVTVPDADKVYHIVNSSDQSITLTRGGGTTLTMTASDRATVYVLAGSGVFHARHAIFTSFGGLSPSADTLAYFTGASSLATTTLTSFARSLIDDASATTARATLDAQEDVITTRGDVVRGSSTNVAERLALGATGTVLASDGTDAVWDGKSPRSYLAGLGMAHAADTDHDITIAVGVARNSTNVGDLLLASALTKRIDASWAVGSTNGGLDGSESVDGTPDADTWYHVHLIKRVDTGVVDALYSESATAPTMPTDYTLFRRIGAVLTDGSANIIAFIQDGDRFSWQTPPLDVNATNPGSSAVSRTLSTPLGVRCLAHMTVTAGGSSVGNESVYLSDLSCVDVAATTPPSEGAITLGFTVASSGHAIAAGHASVMTNTSSAIRSRLQAGANGSVLTIYTVAWTDRRGRDD